MTARKPLVLNAGSVQEIQTGDTINADTATALATARNIDGQAFNGTASITVIAPGTHAATGKTTPVDADELPLVDSAAGNVLKKLTWANLKATVIAAIVGTANSWAANQTFTGYQIIGGFQKNVALVYYDSGTTNALNYTNGCEQRWAPNTGAQTLTISNWPTSGNLGELLIEGVNLGAATITWPTINWVKSDGSTTTVFANNGVTLQSSGTDWVLLWTRDGGTTIYGKVMR